jgi:hypothetical protein
MKNTKRHISNYYVLIFLNKCIFYLFFPLWFEIKRVVFSLQCNMLGKMCSMVVVFSLQKLFRINIYLGTISNINYLNTYIQLYTISFIYHLFILRKISFIYLKTYIISFFFFYFFLCKSSVHILCHVRLLSQFGSTTMH